ncbi:MAG: hypothetical protein Q7S21_06095 [archaeon]|nr:hypothetical protein [archaeon]
MNQKQFRIVGIVIVVLIIALLAFALLFPKPKTYSYAIESKGVMFYSDISPPADLLKELAKKRTFIISPQLDEKNSNVNAVTDSMLVWLGVLQASDKNAVSLIRAVDAKNNLINCRSNLGNPRTDVELSASECNYLLSKEHPSVKIIILAPNNSLSNPEAVLEEDIITIKPAKTFDESRVSLQLLNAMFSDVQAIIDKINELAKKISG